MKANIPQRTDTPLQLHGASQVNIRCPIFYLFSNRTATPAWPIASSGLGLIALNLAIDWRERIDLIAFRQNISPQYSFECYFFSVKRLSRCRLEILIIYLVNQFLSEFGGVCQAVSPLVMCGCALTREAKAAPGSGCLTRDSPMRAALAPALTTWLRSSGVWIPDSLTMRIFFP